MRSDSFESFGNKIVCSNNFSLSISPESKEEADTLFDALSGGGKVGIPMEDAFWGAPFGNFTD
jgi:PhnB protein